MGYWCDEAKVKEFRNIRSLPSKIAQAKILFGCGTIRNSILTIWCSLLFFIFSFVCFVTSGYAMDVTLKWIPNNELNLAGYSVYYRQEGQSYDYTNPYWETTDPTCTIYDLDENKTYYFIVRAFSVEGFQSGDSNEVRFEAGTTTGH